MRPYAPIVLLLLCACRPDTTPAQEEVVARNELAPIEAPLKVAHSIEPSLPQNIVNISEIPGIALDLRYRTSNNFMGTDLYGDYEGNYLHRDAAEKLRKASEILLLTKPGWKLRVLDALRPREIQERMWQRVRGTSSSKYVADPRVGSGHSYGMSVDVTLEDEAGREIDMGTAFDDFTPLAQPRHEVASLRNGKLTRQQYENRLLLRRIMKQAGFGSLLQEWWHFNARGMKTIKSRYKIVEKAF